MNDSINRQAVLDFPIRLDNYDEENGNRDFVLGIESVMDYVESLPSAEPKSGYWINTYGEDWICSNCGVATNADEDYRTDDDRAYQMNYCHYCGADMRRGDSE